jgi:hypothetical protein
MKQADTPNSAYNQGWFAVLRTLVQFRKWDEILSDTALPVPMKARQKAWYHWARGLAKAAKNDALAASSEARRMDEAMQALARATKRKVTPELLVARKELAGHVNIARQRFNSGFRKLEAASRDERRLPYTEPPHYPRPVAEAIGQAALRRGDPQTAERAFRVALEQYPADFHAQTSLRSGL